MWVALWGPLPWEDRLSQHPATEGRSPLAWAHSRQHPRALSAAVIQATTHRPSSPAARYSPWSLLGVKPGTLVQALSEAAFLWGAATKNSEAHKVENEKTFTASSRESSPAWRQNTHSARGVQILRPGVQTRTAEQVSPQWGRHSQQKEGALERQAFLPWLFQKK